MRLTCRFDDLRGYPGVPTSTDTHGGRNLTHGQLRDDLFYRTTRRKLNDDEIDENDPEQSDRDQKQSADNISKHGLLYACEILKTSLEPSFFRFVPPPSIYHRHTTKIVYPDFAKSIPEHRAITRLCHARDMVEIP